MQWIRSLLIGIFLSLFSLLFSQNVYAATYYIDATGGNDTYDGTAPTYSTGVVGPWQTIGKVNSTSFNPGDQVLFKKGQTWTETLVMPSSGTSGNTVVFGSYGSGNNPVIYGSATVTGMNQAENYQQDGTTTAYNTYDSGIASGSPTTNSNTTTEYFNQTGVGRKRYLLAFPNLVGSGAHQIPSGSTISSASLTLRRNSGNLNNGQTVEVYRITRNWNPVANEGTVTWNTYDGTNSWTTPGGDVAATPIATYTFTADQPTTITIDMTSAVQEIVNGTPNYGWLIRYSGTETGSAYFQADSRDNATVSYRPLLTVTANQVSGSYVYTKTGVTNDPKQVFQDGSRLIKATSLGTMVAGSYYWDSSGQKLYVWTTDNANPTSHTIEMSSLWWGIDFNGKSYLDVNGIDVTKTRGHGYDFTVKTGAHDITVTNATSSWNALRGFSLGVYSQLNTSNISFKNSTGNDNIGEGFWIGNGTNNGCDNCTAYNDGNDTRDKGYPTTGMGSGIVIGIYAVDNYVRNSYIHDIGYNYPLFIEWETGYNQPLRTILENNVVVSGNNTSVPTVATQGNQSIIRNNVVYGTYTSNLITVGSGTGADHKSASEKFYNNTLNQNGATWSFAAVNATNLEFKNNIIFNGASGKSIGAWTAAQTGFVSDYNILSGNQSFYWQGGTPEYNSDFATWQSVSHLDSHSLSTAPTFVDLASQNFQLAAGSAGIDAGTNVGVNVDKKNVTRPQQSGYDIGAFEFAVTSSPTVTTGTSVNTNSSSSTPSSSSDLSDKTCQSPKPEGVIDLFQVTRKGQKVTLYFTPLANGTDRYHVIFGFKEGDERYGGIDIGAQNDNQGVQTLTIDHLNPKATYSFKISPVSGCAVGDWSNWLTTKGYSGSAARSVYRYLNSQKK